MARGGSLPGERRGGRQKGSLNKRTIAKETFKGSLMDVSGVSPLDIMLGAARAAWREAHGEDGTVDVKKAQIAADIAKDAAPYLHSRLMPTVLPGGESPAETARKIREALIQANDIEMAE